MIVFHKIYYTSLFDFPFDSPFDSAQGDKLRVKNGLRVTFPSTPSFDSAQDDMLRMTCSGDIMLSGVNASYYKIFPSAMSIKYLP